MIGGDIAHLTFHGVRGSTPCNGESTARYGGNTSCVSVDVPGHEPIVFDLGTGLRYFGLGWPDDEPFRGSCLLSHLHWDHVQGLPFFPPLLRHDAHLDVYAPEPDDGSTLGEVMWRTINPPLFPVGLDAFPGKVTFHAVTDHEFSIGDVRVMSRLIPHVGRTCGYRIEWNRTTVAYLSDHQQTGVRSFEATAGAKELCRGVDVMIHDAQYTRAEFAKKSTWGHCTVEYAVWLAIECRAKTLVLFHHDPTHDDDQIDRIVAAARRVACSGLEIVAASEGLTMPVAR